MNFGIVCYDEVKYLLQKMTRLTKARPLFVSIDFWLTQYNTFPTVRIAVDHIPTLLIQQALLISQWQNNLDRFSF